MIDFRLQLGLLWKIRKLSDVYHHHSTLFVQSSTWTPLKRCWKRKLKWKILYYLALIDLRKSINTITLIPHFAFCYKFKSTAFSTSISVLIGLFTNILCLFHFLPCICVIQSVANTCVCFYSKFMQSKLHLVSHEITRNELIDLF